jgi:excisionase family DNA binding protein
VNPPPYALGPDRVARMLGCSPTTVVRWVDSGLLPGRRLPFGTRRRVRVADLVAFADRHGMGDLVTAAGLRRGGG